MRALARSVFACLAGTLLLLGTGTARAEPQDPWWGPDKALHFGVSAGLAAGGYGISAIWLDARWQRASVGAGSAVVIGAGKEAYDATGHGDASFKDFTWDVAGAAVGTALALLVDVLVSPQHDAPAPARRGISFGRGQP
jgi:putative lipoprotein